jgi:hypothetical protein
VSLNAFAVGQCTAGGMAVIEAGVKGFIATMPGVTGSTVQVCHLSDVNPPPPPTHLAPREAQLTVNVTLDPWGEGEGLARYHSARPASGCMVGHIQQSPHPSFGCTRPPLG